MYTMLNISSCTKVLKLFKNSIKTDKAMFLIPYNFEKKIVENREIKHVEMNIPTKSQHSF